MTQNPSDSAYWHPSHTTGENGGPPRTDEDRADRDWMRAQITAIPHPAHRTIVLSSASGTHFTAHCVVCRTIAAGGYKQIMETMAAIHQENRP